MFGKSSELTANEADTSCTNTIGAYLASFHSLEDVERFQTLRQNHGVLRTWIWLGVICCVVIHKMYNAYCIILLYVIYNVITKYIYTYMNISTTMFLIVLVGDGWMEQIIITL